ncbi:MAG: oxidoreductase [Candidatus Electrothrix sp. AX2]|nr:oxidoreductase [Candidatus Electrothrix gigas]
MKQVVQNFKNGLVSVEDVPKPILRPGCVLVRNKTSLISAGTERGTVQLGKMSMLGKARARPEQATKVLKALRSEGVIGTVSAVNRTLDIPIPLGYSCAGIVESTAEDVHDLPAGTKVACGGEGMATHSDYVVIPRNLCVPIPDNVNFQEAAFTTVGAIAMQGTRIAKTKLGENVVVIGLGLIGLLTVEILKIAGCRVFGIDVNPQRVTWVNENGICQASLRNSASLMDAVLEFSDGYGADAVIIAAAVNSNDPVALAGELARHKGRVVVVGRTVMEAPRETYLFKELELCTSYAYGPGTGDASYELQGHDYPIGYVRWTENRNMACFLELRKENKINLEQFVSNTFSVDNAPTAFTELTQPDNQSIGLILQYKDEQQADQEAPVANNVKGIENSNYRPTSTQQDKIRIGIIGAGSFATNVIVPLLGKRKDIEIKAIVSANGLKAAALAKKYQIPQYDSDAKAILDSDEIDAVFILTRHGTHAPFTERALLNNKHVFVEKPLALNEQELNAVIAAQKATGKVLMVGFNRCFSPLAQKMKAFFADRCQPMMISFRGNVGYRPPEHWLHDPVDGGGVVLGEACHYIDFCRWLTGSPITEATSRYIGESNTKIIREDNVEIALRFEDGSIANILYISNGARGYCRESCEVHSESKSAVWKDFRYVKLVEDLKFPKVHRSILFHEKGYKEELDAFFAVLKSSDDTLLSKIDWLPSQINSSLNSIIAVTK